MKYLKNKIRFIMRQINYIAIHCTATLRGREVSVEEVKAWHIKRGFRTIGYHFLIHLDGTVSVGRPISEIGAHVAGFNKDSIGICYVGGLDFNKTKTKTVPSDTRTPEQKDSLITLLTELKKRFPNAKIMGHRDFPSVNKACPCFDAMEEYKGM